MKKICFAILLIFALSVSAFAMEQGAYGVYANTNYYNPDTGAIEDGGSANAALGEGMCRSATDTRALVEFDGTNYYVTIRLLLQSNTKDVIFWNHTGVNQYSQVNYSILAENAMEDSIDYRFLVDDPFAPIKASMYVTPMGRSTLWFIELDESSLSKETGDFVVSVTAPEPAPEPTPEPVPAPEPTPQEPVVEETVVPEATMEIPEPEETETPSVDDGDIVPQESEEPEVLETVGPQEEEPKEETPAQQEPVVDESADTVVQPEKLPEDDVTVTEEKSTDVTVYVVLGVLLVVGSAVFILVKKGKKNG